MPSLTTAHAAAVLAAGVVGTAALGAAGARPGDSPLPGCLLRAATGVACPLCGTTGSLLALGGGDPAAAVALNPLGPVALVLAVAVLAVLALRLATTTPQGAP